MGAGWIEDEDTLCFERRTRHGKRHGFLCSICPITALDGLNSEFLSWWPDYYKLSGEAGEIPTTLGRFALMNGTEHFGFFTYEG